MLAGKKVKKGMALTLLSAVGCEGNGNIAEPLDVRRGPAGSYSSCLQNFVSLGRSMQGRSMQGRSMQGRSMQGMSIDGWSVQAIRIGCSYVDKLALQGTVLTGELDGRPIRGLDFIGAEVIEMDWDGNYATSTLSAIETDPKDASGETLLYALTYIDDTGTTQNSCIPDREGVAKAIPVSGSWDESGAHIASDTVFTFSCTKGVIAKCVRWGYKPFKSVNGKSLADYHQACTRMARADYCGDGVTHTQDDTLIDIYDDLRIQVKSSALTLPLLIFDAAWTTEGAYCMTKDRWLALSQLLSVTLNCKTKFNDLFPLVETSPVDALDTCTIKRKDLSRSDVRMDNKSGINIQLF